MRSRSKTVRSLPAAVGPALVRWYRANRRPLPWRVDRDPYRVWVAEVLLQQTRVAQAIPYFERFVREFPDVRSLARAPIARVLKLWEGAGYYARAHHLREAAVVLVNEHSGRLPSTAAELETLPGVGPYIARAVAAIAFDRREVALEANGLRVAARWTLERGNLQAPVVRARLEGALKSVLPKQTPGLFTEAVMELGETVCLPVHPRCEVCPVAFACRARHELPDPGVLPYRTRRMRRPHVRAAVVVLSDGRGRWLVQQRPPTGLLPGLWEFPGGKIRDREEAVAAARRELHEETGVRAGALEPAGTVRHAYSHFTVELQVFVGRLPSTFVPEVTSAQRWLSATELRRRALPKATEKVVALLEARDTDRPGSGSRPGRTHPSRPATVRPPRRRAPPRGTDA